MAISTIAIKAGLVMPGASAFSLTPSQLVPLVPPPSEPLASYHWAFGTDYPDLADLISGAKLQPAIRLAINAGGSGYEASGPLAFSGGGATQQATGIWFATGGVITGAYVTSPGAGYTSAPAVTATTSSGTGATLTTTLGGLGTLNTASLTVPPAFGSGLVTPATERADQTICAVIKVNKSPPASNVGVVFGTLFNSSTVNTGGVATGSGLFLQSSGYAVTTRPGGASAVAPPAGVADGGYAFVALSEATGGGRIAYWGGSAPTVYTATQVKSLVATPPKVAIGNTYYNATGNTHEFAELIYIPRSTTQAELDAIYARSKARMSERGLAIY